MLNHKQTTKANLKINTSKDNQFVQKKKHLIRGTLKMTPQTQNINSNGKDFFGFIGEQLKEKVF